MRQLLENAPPIFLLFEFFSWDIKLLGLSNKLKSLKVAKSKDDDGGVVDGSVDAGDVNGVLMLCVMVHVMVCLMVCVMVWVMV